ncbi:ABC transporter ATP-binding protein [Sebaldella sp. S0638]|uniref:ABC transporter ATP-binding protein n=1 Tax=Sebaldella sp. S0638 TaxID=2957809 RepID=UPI0020A1522A|nr:ABC transporter ATP-binding protein [Sebaldella sp. S0638]MCP1223904.1 ABC transporter ATP-binding protein [Sebaldella sp. S0638]
MEAIKIENLTKIYKTGNKVLDNLNLTVESGNTFSLLGVNGAGKSTLINILTTFINSTSGKACIFGKDITKEKKFVRRNISCVAQQISIDEHLSLYENMLFQSRLYKIDSLTAKKRIHHLIEAFGLQEYEKYKISAYSGGIKRRLDIAMSMISSPKILFLDEPTVGMDVESRRTMWKLINNIKQNFKTTIFLTTHYLEEADILSDKICIIKNGSALVQDTPENLRYYTDKNIIKISLKTPGEMYIIEEKLINADFIYNMRRENNSLILDTQNNEQNFYTINRLLMENNINYNGIEVSKPSLEDVFISFINDRERGI